MVAKGEIEIYIYDPKPMNSKKLKVGLALGDYRSYWVIVVTNKLDDSLWLCITDTYNSIETFHTVNI